MTYRRASWPPVLCARLAAKASALSHSGVSSTTTRNFRRWPSAKIWRFRRALAWAALSLGFGADFAVFFGFFWGMASCGHGRGMSWPGPAPAIAPSGKVDCETLEIAEIHDFERRFMGRRQNDARRAAGLERFAPAHSAQAPAIAGLQSREVEVRLRRRKIVAARLGEGEELRRDFDADRVQSEIVPAGMAAASAKETG